MFLKNKYYLLILCAVLSLGYAAVSFSDDCTELTTLSQYGVIGQADFNAGNDSTINNNNITGSGNTPTPTGTSETINETFPPIDPAVFPATGGDDIDVSNEAISVAADGYSKITFEAGNNNKTIIFTGGNYYIEELNLKKNNAVIQLAPGDYFIEKLTMENKTSIVLSGNGPVRLFIKESFQAGNDVKINAGGSVSDFTLFLYDSASMQVGNSNNSNSDLGFSGIIYSPYDNTSIQFGNNNDMEASIISKGSVSVGDNTSFTYDADTQAEFLAAFGCADDISVDHYAVSYPSGNPGITCEVNAVAVTAHDSNHDPFIPAAGTIISLSASPQADGWSLKSGDGTFTAPDQYEFDGIERSVQFWLSESSPTVAPHINIGISENISGTTEDSGEDEHAQFLDTAFRFFDNSTGLPAVINTQIAGKPSFTAPDNQTLELRAVKTNTSTSACEAALDGTTAVEFAYECNNPLNCSAGNLLALTGAETKNIAGNNNGSVTSYTSVNMTFDSNGIAPFSFNYKDAGQIQLYARKTLTSPAATLSGSSNAFVARPFGFYMSGLTTAADASAANVFARAGDNFSTTVTAKIWVSGQDADFNGIADSHDNLNSNAATPGFGHESSAQNMTISHTLRHPVSGSSGSLTGDTSLAAGGGGSDYSSGVTGNVSLSWDEVGIIDLNATLNNYLNSGDNISSSKNNVGRFSAHHFAVTSNLPDFADSCNPFTYLDQAFYYNTAPVLTVTAKNAAGSTCDNYGGGSSGADGFWKLSSSLNRSFADGHSTAPFAALSVTTGGSVSLSDETDYDGEAVFAQTAGNSGDEFSYNKNAVEVPFNADIDISYTADAFTDDDGICYDPDDNGACDEYSLTISEDTTAAATELRYGRMVLFDVYGSELNSLNMPLSLEYWDTISGNTTYFINSDDSCTTLAVSDILFSDYSGNLSAGEVSALSVSVSNAQGSVSLSAPGGGNDGKVCVNYDVNGSGSGTIQSWLEDNWSCAAGSSSSPMGHVRFGIHPGNNRQIYMREQY